MSKSASCATEPFCAIAISSISKSNSLGTAHKSGSSLAEARNPGAAFDLASEARVVVILGEGSLGKGVCERACGARGVSYGFQRETGKARGGDLAGGG